MQLVFCLARDKHLTLIRIQFLKELHTCMSIPFFVTEGTSRQRLGKGAIRKRFPLQKTEAGKTQSNNKVLNCNKPRRNETCLPRKLTGVSKFRYIKLIILFLSVIIHFAINNILTCTMTVFTDKYVYYKLHKLRRIFLARHCVAFSGLTVCRCCFVCFLIITILLYTVTVYQNQARALYQVLSDCILMSNVAF